MAERGERFFWLYMKRADHAVVSAIEELHREFVARWHECPLIWMPCVKQDGPTDQLWLFRLSHGIGNSGIAIRFSKQFQRHIQTLQERLNLKGKLKRRSNLPTPLLLPRIELWPPTDVGLHAVNDEYNGMLVTYSYYSGRYYQPPHLQISTLRQLVSSVAAAWQKIGCDCHGGECPECKGDGCYYCFRLNCAHCDGTGWKHFSQWAQGGFRIKYDTGFPIAEL